MGFVFSAFCALALLGIVVPLSGPVPRLRCAARSARLPRPPVLFPLRTFCRPHVRGRLPCRPGTLHAGVVLNFRAVPRVRLVTRGQSHGVCHGVSSVAHLALFCLHFTRAFAMDLAAPRQTFGLSAGIVCASLPAVTFPAFVQLASVLLGKLLHSLRCGRPFLPAYERQRCAASAAGTGSGDVAMAAAPAQQLRLPRRSAPRDSAMADAPPLRLPPPRAGPARAPPAEHPAAQPDFAMAEAAALSQPQLPAPGRLGPAVRVRTTAATRPARLPQLMPPASPSGQLPLRALPVPPPAAPAPAPPVPAARTRAPHATGATALPAAQRQRPQRRPPGPLVLPPPPPLPPPPALPGPPRMRAPQRRRAPPGPSSPAATSGSERALRPSSPVRHRRAGDTASRRNPPRQRALHGPWYSCTGRPSSGAPARP